MKKTKKASWFNQKPGCLAILLKATGILVLGYFVFFYPILQYQRTLIEWHIPLIAGGIVGLTVAVFRAKRMKVFFPVAFTVGFAFNGILFFLNDAFSERQKLEFKLVINKKYPSYRKAGPRAEVKYHDVNQMVNAASDEELKEVSYAVLTVDKGLFDYYIIRAYRLEK